MAGWINKKKILPLSLFLLLSAGVAVQSFRKASPKAAKATSPKLLERIPVSIARVSKSAMGESFSMVGTVEAWREADIFAESGGVVRRVSAEPGTHKKAGETLFLLDNDLSALRQRKAETWFQQKKRDLERSKSLYNEGAISLSTYETAQLQRDDAEADLITASRKNSDATVKAPFAGVVTARFVEQGELAREGAKVAHLVDLSKVKVVLFVPERDMKLFVEGAPLKVSSDLFAGESWTGKVGAISEKSGRDHTFRVEVVVQNSGKATFRSGMFARVFSSAKDDRQVITVPRVALVSGRRKPELFVVRNGKAFLTPFVAGSEFNKSIEVVDGVAVGDSVVISGQNELHDSAPVIVIDQQATPAKP